MIVDRYGFIRHKLLPYRISSSLTFESLWDQMELLKSKEQVIKLIKRSIEHQFYGLDLDLILTQRNKFKKTRECGPLEFIKDEDQEVKIAASKVVSSIKQAQEYYKAANAVGPLTKPVLLYYGMVSLAKATISSTYKIPEFDRLGHGLNVINDDLKVKISRCGEFQLFRDTYIGDTSIYTSNDLLILEVKELLKTIQGIANEYRLTYQELPDKNNIPSIPEYDEELSKFSRTPIDEPYSEELNINGNVYQVIYDKIRGLPDGGKLSKIGYNHFIHILDAHFLIMFILCSFARYKPFKWNQIIENSHESVLLKSFLRRSELDFPILIYSEITGMKTFFDPF